MSRPRWYTLDANGDPQPEPDYLKAAQWFETADRRIAQDMDEGHDGDPTQRIKVSTVFLGLDHSYSDDGPPILWETLVFGGLLDGEMMRYTSKEEALEGHQEMCQRVMATIHRP